MSGHTRSSADLQHTLDRGLQEVEWTSVNTWWSADMNRRKWRILSNSVPRALDDASFKEKVQHWFEVLDCAGHKKRDRKLRGYRGPSQELGLSPHLMQAIRNLYRRRQLLRPVRQLRATAAGCLAGSEWDAKMRSFEDIASVPICSHYSQSRRVGGR
eukprot:g13392.t1